MREQLPYTARTYVSTRPPSGRCLLRANRKKNDSAPLPPDYHPLATLMIELSRVRLAFRPPIDVDYDSFDDAS